MKKSWKILLYQPLDKESPVVKFIETQETHTQAKIYNTINLLKEYGIELGLPHIKKLSGSDMWELRILGSNNIRFFYIAMTGKSFIILHGFKKKTNKTPQKEIKTAEKRLKEYTNR